MKPIAFVSHFQICPILDEGVVASGAGSVNGIPIVCVGSSIGCSAIIKTGATNTLTEGRAKAQEGDTTSQSGTLIESAPRWRLE